MENDNQEIHICECGKCFRKIRQLTGHQSHCKAHIQKLHQDKENRRLPNGLFKCDNPKCNKEHDGSYGSGRFCCKKCRDQYNGITSFKTSIANGTYKSNLRFRKDDYRRSPFGTWSCKECNFIAKTRRELVEHKRLFSHRSSCKGRPLSQYHKEKISKALKGRIGRKFTDEQRQKAREKALNRTVPVSTKRTEDYKCIDGTIVRLDSSYERTIARILDENNINWIRPKPLDWYSKDGTKHHYFPDFYLTDYNIYLDPKNEYCFKVQAEKIEYILNHYNNCYFLHKNELTKEKIFEIIEQ